MRVSLSIIIPTANRASYLAQTLDSIKQFKDVPSFETIVVDNGSADNTKEVCLQFAELLPGFKYVYEPIPGLLSGRHKGAELASGDILSYIDDDVQLAASWLDGIHTAFADDAVDLVTGPCLPKFEVEPPQWIGQLWTKAYEGSCCIWLSLLDLGERRLEIHPNFVWGLNFSIRKNIFYRLGGFHPDNIPEHLQMYQGNGETGLTEKAHQHNCKAVYVPEVRLYHQIPAERLTVHYLKKRAFYEGVCASYSDLRNSIDIDTTAAGNSLSGTHQTVNNSFNRIVFRKLKKFIKSFVQSAPVSVPEELERVNCIINSNIEEGYRFHQEMYRTHEFVRQWVHKENYFDYNFQQC